MQPAVIYVTHTVPSEVGNGGVHRSYQVLHELEKIVGRDRVLVLTADFLASLVNNGTAGSVNGSRRVDQTFRQWVDFRTGTVVRFAKNPYRLFHRTAFATGLHPVIKDYYASRIKEISARAICVLDHAQFAELIPINREHHIPTVSCTQNLDALGDDFDSIASNLAAYSGDRVGTQQRLALYATMTDFANELQSLAQCDERLFISKLEAGLMSGVGLSYHYYPYVPVGGLRQRQDEIRRKRLSSAREPGLFLLVGSASYAPIRKSCEWFIQNAKEHGMPPGVRVVVVGAGTNKLLPPGESVPGIELKGWTEQEELDLLLVRAQAVLVPQQFGFGAPTRLSELSCAGIPVIGCHHPTYAIDPPPGFHVTEAIWEDWYARIEQLRCEDAQVPEDEYNTWEAAQPKPLAGVVSGLLG
jgi:hypothetical protein